MQRAAIASISHGQFLEYDQLIDTAKISAKVAQYSGKVSTFAVQF